MAVRDAVAKYRPPLLNGAALAAAGALVGLLVAVAALVLPNDTRRDYLLALTSGPGLTHAIVMKGQEASEAVHAGWGDPVVAASWPASGDPARPGGEVRVRAPLFFVTTLWGLSLGLLLSLLWQSTAARAPILGGFVAGALAGLALAFAIMLGPSVIAWWWVGGVSGLPGFETRLEQGEFARAVVQRGVIVRWGPHEVMRIEETPPRPSETRLTEPARETVTLSGVGIVALMTVLGLFGVAVGLLLSGLRRLHRPLAIFPLGVGLGLAVFLLLPFAPLGRLDQTLPIFGRQVLHSAPASMGVLTRTPLGPRVDAALLPVLVAAALVLATPVVLLTSVVAAASARRREHARRLEEERRLAEEEAERLRPVEPIPVLPDDRLRPGS